MALSPLLVEVKPSHVILTHCQMLHTVRTLFWLWHLSKMSSRNVFTSPPFLVICSDFNDHEKLPSFEPIFVISAQ